MKKFIILLILIGSIATIEKAQAQHISVSININSQPSWGPTGYDYVDYYYLPDINVYYNVNNRKFVYLDGRRWITARYLPHRYRNYDLYNMYKVVLVGGHHNPWVNNRIHYRDYGRYRNYRGQAVIRESRSPKYNHSRNNNYLWYRDSQPQPNRRQNDRQAVRPSSPSRDYNNNRPNSNRPSNNRNSTINKREKNKNNNNRNNTQSTRRSNSTNFRTISQNR